MKPAPFALTSVDTAVCGRRQGSAMNSHGSALTPVLASREDHLSGRSGQPKPGASSAPTGNTLTQNRGHSPVTGPFLDRNYLTQWAHNLKLTQLLERLLAPPIG